MTKHSLKLLFLRKYRTSKKYYRQLKLPSAINGASLTFTGVLGSGSGQNGTNDHINRSNGTTGSYPTSTRRPTGYVYKPVDTVDCCELMCDCLSFLSHYKLRAFVFIVVVGIVSTSGLYFHNQNQLQYRLSINNTNTNSASKTNNELPHANIDTSPTNALKKLLLKFSFQHKSQQNDDIVPSLNRVYREDVFSTSHGIRLRRCTIPVLQPFAGEVKQFIAYTPRPICIHEQNNPFNDEIPFSIRNGNTIVRNPKLDGTHTKGCCYRPFHRNGDNGHWSSNYCKEIKEEITHVPDEIEYVEILCINSATQTDFRDALSLTPRKNEAETRVETFEAVASETSPSSLSNRLSVIILGLDATSRMNFLRAMPKSNKYLLKTMSAISLDGYTKVADNTLPNVIPLLSGRTLEEFKKLCVDESLGGSSVHLDGCPFIWKVFAENGYRTGLSEDDVDIGIFNMNWADAFTERPTDYYLRPFSRLVQRRHSFKNGFCYGASLSFEKLLDNIKCMAETFKGQTFFQFTWSTKLSHDDFNKLKWGDESLLQLLQHLHSGHYLNNTALLVIGDHGSRLDRIRSTAQGKLEDRMPVAYIALPKWFRNKYHLAYRNLRKNSNRITSAFDIHKTLHDFLDTDRLLHKKNESVDSNGDEDVMTLPNGGKVSLGHFRGVSLFNELPENRTCFAAGVPLHWCICHRKLPMEKDTDADSAGEFVVTALNTLLKDQSGCSELLLQSVDEVSKWDSSEIVREGCLDYVKQVGNNGTVKANNSDNTDCNGDNSKVRVLQLAFTTTPGDATFETTVIKLSNGSWKLTEDVVRTNAYEGQSDCVEQKYKPYCYCSDDDDSFFDRFFK